MINIHIRDLKNGTFWVNFNDTSLIFDDIELEENEAWSQICSRCAERYNIPQDLISQCAGMPICGVEGCQNEADYYIDFKEVV